MDKPFIKMTFTHIQEDMKMTSAADVRALNFELCLETLCKLLQLGLKETPNFQALFEEVHSGKGGHARCELVISL
jgi:hypothetical protein